MIIQKVLTKRIRLGKIFLFLQEILPNSWKNGVQNLCEYRLWLYGFFSWSRILMVTTRAKAVNPPLLLATSLSNDFFKMSVLSVKISKRNFIQNDDLDIEPKNSHWSTILWLAQLHRHREHTIITIQILCQITIIPPGGPKTVPFCPSEGLIMA